MKNILFICGQNKLRSPTAEAVFATNLDWNVRSAGLKNNSEVQVGADDVGWAEYIFVMENSHKKKLQERFRAELNGQKVICLGIPDNYEYMDEEIELLQATEKEVLQSRKGTWSLAHEIRLKNLLQLQASSRPDRMRPFLIRAIAKSEHREGFYATECDVGVGIRHGSVGSMVPKSIRLPAVVFLLESPAKVLPTWEMAD